MVFCYGYGFKIAGIGIPACFFYWRYLLKVCKRKKGYIDEKNISAQSNQACPNPRLSKTDVHQRGTGCYRSSSCQGTQTIGR
jgi:hypothetical protein